MTASGGTAAVVVVDGDTGLGPASHRPVRAARARLLADACDAMTGVEPRRSPEGAVWVRGDLRVAMTRTNDNGGRLLVALTASGPDHDDRRGAVIRVHDAHDAPVGERVRPDTLRVAAALLRASAGVLDGSGPSLTTDEWNAASSALCARALADSRDGPDGDLPVDGDPFAMAVAAATSLLPKDRILHDHKPLGALNVQSLHWHSPGGIHPVAPPACPAAAGMSVDRQGRVRLTFLWIPGWSGPEDDPVATLRALAALRGAEAASLATRPEDRA
jgi:hypothetical protein